MSVCEALHLWANSKPIHTYPFDRASIPRNGIYILFENGETAHGGRRIVRIGTHTGDNQLWSRLCQHFVHENKDRSIFRKNIGRALLNRDGDPFLRTWEIDLTSKNMRAVHAGVDLARQPAIEQEVSSYMRRNFSFSAVQVDSKAERLAFEAKMISTLWCCETCQPSPLWLGRYSTKTKIRESGLWLVNELNAQELDAQDLERLTG